MVWVALDRIATVLLDAKSHTEYYKRQQRENALLDPWNLLITFAKETRHGEWHILAPAVADLSMYEAIQRSPQPHIQGIRSDNGEKCTLRISSQGVDEIRVWYNPENCIGGEDLQFIDDNRTVVQDIVPNVFD
jgi:hypothetical protein